MSEVRLHPSAFRLEGAVSRSQREVVPPKTVSRSSRAATTTSTVCAVDDPLTSDDRASDRSLISADGAHREAMTGGDAIPDGRPAISTYGIQREGMYDEEARTDEVVATVGIRASTSDARLRATAIGAADDDRVDLMSTNGARCEATAMDITTDRGALFSTSGARRGATSSDATIDRVPLLFSTVCLYGYGFLRRG